jgi:uncharacterized delta-60 repeat protein/uncharacterized repeat protein (TIGR02543 family)
VFRIRAVTGLGFLAAALVVAVGSADAQPAVLDPSFGGGSGMVTTSIGASASADSVVLQPDGKIVAAGGVTQADKSQDFAVARYGPGGALDPAFGSGGIVQAPAGTARAVALQPDGKIVAAGASSTEIRVARYDADGSLDASFGTGGVVTTPVGTGNSDANALLVLPDGKIVVGGGSSDGSRTLFTLVRYDASGSLDPTFGSGGIVTTQVGAGNSSVEGLALQPDGKIVADGDAVNGSNQGVPGLARYDADGALDATFGSGGIVATHVGSAGASVNVGPLALQSDGKIVVTVGFAVLRYETNGTLDPTFASGASLSGGPGPPASGLALQPDGKILVAGQTLGGMTGFADTLELFRLNANGAPDGTFSNGGLAFLFAWTGSPTSPPAAASPAIALQPDEKIVAVGSQSVDGGVTQRFLLARFGASTLTVNLSNSAGQRNGAGGNITSNPAGIDCSTDFGCIYPPNFIWQHAFAAGTVTLTATPWDGYLFAGWSGGGCSGTGTCQVQMSGGVTGDQSITATFTPAPTKALTVTKAGTGAGRIASLPHPGPGGIFCFRSCTSDFGVGVTVTLTATATSPWSTFTGWSGDCSGKGNCTVTMSTNRAVKATFQHFCIVPRLKGKTLRIAKLRLHKAHCFLGRVTLASSKVKKGRVVSQKPAAGRHLVGHSRVRLELSKGKHHR